MQVSVQEIEATRILVLLAAVAIVAYWRTIVAWLIVLAATAVIATLGISLIVVWQLVHHVVA
jgi:hypothetical protein